MQATLIMEGIMRLKNVFFMAPLLIAAAAFADESAVTVYNNNLAAVRSMRPMEINAGTGEVKFADVAAQMDPTSVHFKSLTAPGKVAILEQNFEYDLVSAEKILEKYIDQTVQLFDKEGKMFEGRLLSSSDDVVLEKRDGEIQSVSRASILNINFPKLPSGLITRPTLVWMLSSDKGGKHDMEVSYLTAGIGWHAEYVAVLDKDDKKMDLSAWVSVDNKSGATYADAKIKLVAGDVNRVSDAVPTAYLRRAMTVESFSADEKQFAEKSFFEYHLYTLQRPATLKNNQIKQISLFPSASVPVKKIYKYDGQTNPKKVSVAMEFLNSKAQGLGLALPAGKVRVYKQDDDKSQEFVGEDRMDHTPKEEKVRLSIGNAFDVAAERKEKEMRALSQRSRQTTVEIKIRNHKDSDIEVLAVERLWDDWEIVKSNFKHAKKDSTTAEFVIPVAKGAEAVLEFTAVTKW